MASIEVRLAALAAEIRRRQFANEGPVDALSQKLRNQPSITSQSTLRLIKKVFPLSYQNLGRTLIRLKFL